jgi:hypothetical protein
MPDKTRKLSDLIRPNLYPGEDKYFKQSPHVGGMASESGHIVLNPYSPPEINKDSIIQNELARLYMRGQIPGEQVARPSFGVTPEQSAGLPKEYQAASPQDQIETIIARQYSGDPSGGIPTGDQKAYVDAMIRALSGYK